MWYGFYGRRDPGLTDVLVLLFSAAILNECVESLEEAEYWNSLTEEEQKAERLKRRMAERKYEREQKKLEAERKARKAARLMDKKKAKLKAKWEEQQRLNRAFQKLDEIMGSTNDDDKGRMKVLPITPITKIKKIRRCKLW